MRMAIGIAIRFEPVIEIACDIEVLKIISARRYVKARVTLVPHQDSGSCICAVAGVAEIVGSEIRPHRQQARGRQHATRCYKGVNALRH